MSTAFDVESLLTVEGFLLSFKDRDWVEDAACKGIGADFFFPPRGVHPGHISKIREICGNCPVQRNCREYGEYERYGFWGGAPVMERMKERNQ